MLDHADYTSSTWQHELGHTDQEYIFFERSASLSGNRSYTSSVRRVYYWHDGSTFYGGSLFCGMGTHRRQKLYHSLPSARQVSNFRYVRVLSNPVLVLDERNRASPTRSDVLAHNGRTCLQRNTYCTCYVMVCLPYAAF